MYCVSVCAHCLCQCVFIHACDLSVIAMCGRFVMVFESVSYCIQMCNKCKTVFFITALSGLQLFILSQCIFSYLYVCIERQAIRADRETDDDKYPHPKSHVHMF